MGAKNYANSNQRKVRVAKFISDRTDFKTKEVNQWFFKRHYIIIKGHCKNSLKRQQFLTHMHLTTAPKSTRQKLTDLQGQTHESAVTHADTDTICQQQTDPAAERQWGQSWTRQHRQPLDATACVAHSIQQQDTTPLQFPHHSRQETTSGATEHI